MPPTHAAAPLAPRMRPVHFLCFWLAHLASLHSSARRNFALHFMPLRATPVPCAPYYYIPNNHPGPPLNQLITPLWSHEPPLPTPCVLLQHMMARLHFAQALRTLHPTHDHASIQCLPPFPQNLFQPVSCRRRPPPTALHAVSHNKCHCTRPVISCPFSPCNECPTAHRMPLASPLRFAILAVSDSLGRTSPALLSRALQPHCITCHTLPP